MAITDKLNLLYMSIVSEYGLNLKIAGKDSYMWVGPTPRVNITDPENISKVLTKISDFPKPHSNPLAELLATGLANYEGDKWAKHRRTINPAFHVEKLKVLQSTNYYSL